MGSTQPLVVWVIKRFKTHRWDIFYPLLQTHGPFSCSSGLSCTWLSGSRFLIFRLLIWFMHPLVNGIIWRHDTFEFTSPFSLTRQSRLYSDDAWSWSSLKVKNRLLFRRYYWSGIGPNCWLAKLIQQWKKSTFKILVSLWKSNNEIHSCSCYIRYHHRYPLKAFLIWIFDGWKSLSCFTRAEYSAAPQKVTFGMELSISTYF